MNFTSLRLLKLIAFISLLACGSVSATNYYLSKDGNDNNNGQSEKTAWCTLIKLRDTQFKIQPGDSILLERGSSFRGKIDLPCSGIYIGDYGKGVKPTIDGSIALTNWKLFKENIWQTECIECTSRPGNLFVDGQTQVLGRYPNKGYLTITHDSQNKMMLTDTVQSFEDDFWNKGELVVRSSRWTIDNLFIKDFNKDIFYLSSPAAYPIQKGYGYFIQNHLLTLDQSGEWFFDNEKKLLFLYMNTDNDPNNHLIETSVLEYGLSANGLHDIRIENIIFQHQRTNGVYLEECVNPVITKVEILNSGKNGLEIISCKNPVVENSWVADTNNNGVVWHNTMGGSFLHNKILRTGLHAGRGQNGDGNYIALRITSDQPNSAESLFQHNTIDSAGYIGIDFRTGNTCIKNNIISNFCMVKDDGAGIYTWGNTNSNNIIESNEVHSGRGTGEGTVNSEQLFAHGIYIDDRSTDILIQDNIISNCATSGIFLHNAKKIALLRNRAANNGHAIANKEKGQLYIKLDTLGQFGGKLELQLTISQNKWLTESMVSPCLYLASSKEKDLTRLGRIEKNEYSAPNIYLSVLKSYEEHGVCFAAEEFSLPEWKRATSYEAGSIFNYLPAKRNSEVPSTNMISKGSIFSSNDGWISWPETASLSIENITPNVRTLKVIAPPNKGEVLVYHSGFPLSNEKLYQLSFSAWSDVKTKLEFVPLMASSPWQALGDYTCFSIDSNVRVFTYYFKPHKASYDARINFKSNSTFRMDHVTLHEVEIPNSRIH